MITYFNLSYNNNRWLLDLCDGIVKEGCIREDWKSSVILPIYTGKGDPMECGSYRGTKLLEHAIKVVERISEYRIRQQIEVDDMQFGFMKSKGTTDAIFTVRQMKQNFRVEGKKLYFGFVDLGKAFDRIPREVIRWAMRKLGVEEGWYRRCLCIQVQKQLLEQFITAPRFASGVLATAIPSVCPSVTRRYCVKTTERSTVQFALSDSKMCRFVETKKYSPGTTPSPWNLRSNWPTRSW